MNAALAAALGPLGQRHPRRHPRAMAGTRAAGDDRRAPAVRRDRPVGVRPRDRPALRHGVRHQAALIILTRDHVGETLRNYVPSAEQAPGRPDVVGRGHDAHLRFWHALEAARIAILPLSLSLAAPHTRPHVAGAALAAARASA